MRTPPVGRARALITIASAAVLLLTGCVAAGGSGGSEPGGSDPGGSAVLHVAPGASGSCQGSDPCSLATALEQAGPGARVELAAGDYGEVELTASGGERDVSDPVVVAPADGEVASFAHLETGVPAVRWEGITVTGPFFVNPGADHSQLAGVHIDGGGLFVRADHVVVRDSLFEGGSSIDGIQIGGASDVLVENTTVRDYDQDADTGLHADCIQLFDVHDVVLRGNRLGNCYNAGIIISGGGDGIRGLLIEANFVQGCVVVSARCGGGSAVELREPGVSGLVVRNNTLLDGSVRWGSVPGAVFDRNIVGYLSDCAAVITNSIVESWNERMCELPASVGRAGNRVGTVAFRDRAAGDLSLASPESARIDPVAGTDPATHGIDGVELPPDLAGASG